MIKFEEHEGQLFRMLDKPVPLTDDTELPVLVRMIQNDTMLGKANKRSCHPDALAIKIICIELTDGGLFLDGHYTYRYEIIGIPVAEGSSEWRNYQLVQGKCVYCPGDSEYYQASGQGRIIGKLIENNEFNSTWNSDTFMRDDSDGWQIYEEPKQPKPKYRVGDSVICEYHRSPLPKQVSYERIIDINDVTIVTQSQNGSVCEYDINGNHGDINGWHIDRVISPSEHIITIGCLSGTVVHSVSEDCFLLAMVNDPQHRACCIDMSMLDTQTRELVEGLLEAQRRGDIK